jgi:hypothetical protein
MSELRAAAFSKFKKLGLQVSDAVLLPLAAVGGVWLKLVRRVGLSKMPLTRNTLRRIGIVPIRDHYYEPFVNPQSIRRSLREDRLLPGIDLNLAQQLAILQRFCYQDELMSFPLKKPESAERTYHYHNTLYGPGDAEYLYSMIRGFKPRRVIEIGSGFSTLITTAAIRTNQVDDPEYSCDVTCIEPYEQPWLEQLNVTVLRKPVEQVDPAIFSSLQANDVLFIDSSHVIRPQGDVLCLYQQVLPTLNSGVFVHIHDIFTPKDYLDDWVLNDVRLWNEQYLLEVFLTFNTQFQITGALNYLAHHHREELASRCPIFGAEASQREPGAFWIQRI